MVDAVGPWDRIMFPWFCSINTTQIDAAFSRIGSALMMGIDAAGLAEVMLCRARPPRVEREVVGPFGDPNGAGGCCYGSSLSARAE